MDPQPAPAPLDCVTHLSGTLWYITQGIGVYGLHIFHRFSMTGLHNDGYVTVDKQNVGNRFALSG